MSGGPPEDFSVLCPEEGQDTQRKGFRRRRRGHRKAGGNSGALALPSAGTTQGCQSEEEPASILKPASILEAFGFAPQRPGTTRPAAGMQEGWLAENKLLLTRSPTAGVCRNVVTWSDLGGPAEPGLIANATRGFVQDSTAGPASTFGVCSEVAPGQLQHGLRPGIEQVSLQAWHSMAQAERISRDKIGLSHQVMSYDAPRSVPPGGALGSMGTMSDMCWQGAVAVPGQWTHDYTDAKRQCVYQGVDKEGVLLPSSADLEVMLKSMASGVYED